MDYSFEELKKKRVNELREIAAGLGEGIVEGYTQLNKDHLLEAICKALKIDMHVHHEVKGINKTQIKAQIKELKKKRDEAITSKNKSELVKVRHKIRNLKKDLRKHMV